MPFCRKIYLERSTLNIHQHTSLGEGKRENDLGFYIIYMILLGDEQRCIFFHMNLVLLSLNDYLEKCQDCFMKLLVTMYNFFHSLF